jgi:polyamine oxidase
MSRVFCIILPFALIAAYVLLVVLLAPRGETVVTATAGQEARQSQPVIIGGAGVAGIELAYQFEKAGVPFVLLEASNILGGRVKAKKFGGFTLEAGANWVQGLGKNPVFQLVQEYGLKGLRNNFDDAIVFDENGNLVEAPYSTDDGALGDDAYVGAGEFSSRCLQAEQPNLNRGTRNFCNGILPSFGNGKRGDDFSNAEAETLFNGFIANTPFRRLIQYYSQDFEWAQEPEVTSANNTLPPNSYKDFVDDNYMALDDPLGYARLFIKRAASFLTTSTNNDDQVIFDDERLLLNTRVLSVDYSGSEVVVRVCTTSATTLHTGTQHSCSGNAREIRGRVFVSTFSTGVMQQSIRERSNNVPAPQRTAPSFTPNLPAATRDAFQNYPMGLYSKIFFRFPWKFWTDNQMLLSAFGSGDFAPVWQSLDLPKFLPGSNIIFVTVTGERARSLQELPNSAASDNTIIAQFLPVLNQIFPDEIRALTGGRLLRRSDVLEFTMERWLQNDLTRGMYSNWKVNRTWEQQQPMRDLVGSRLWLSGEATCFRYNGYTHGAMLAGQRTANLILRQEFGRTDASTESICDTPPKDVDRTESNQLLHGPGYPRS